MRQEFGKRILGLRSEFTGQILTSTGVIPGPYLDRINALSPTYFWGAGYLEHPVHNALEQILFQTDDTSTPVTTASQPVGRIRGIVGGIDGVQATSGRRPQWLGEGVGCEHDDDWIVLGTAADWGFITRELFWTVNIYGRILTTVGAQTLFACRQNSGGSVNGCRLGSLNGGALRWILTLNNSSTFFDQGTVDVANDHHYTLVRDNEDLIAYIDGVEVGTGVRGTTISVNDPQGALRIGANVDDVAPLEGRHQILEAWDRALTPAELTAWMASAP
jgi:hypothetical protein